MIDISWSKISRKNRIAALYADLEESVNLLKRSIIRGKLFYYFFERQIGHFFLKNFSLVSLRDKSLLNKVDFLLRNDGGLFRRYVYSISNRLIPIRGSLVLVAGVGYGRNILQLASFRPSKIIAFDPLDFGEELEWVKEKVRNLFGVSFEYATGGFETVSSRYDGKFNFVMSDAVLMHVRDMKNFAMQSAKFLSPGGIFYASYGPPWFGPRGDMLPWKIDEAFNHVLLSPSFYREKTSAIISESHSISSGYEEYFSQFIRETPFSFLTGSKYLSILEDAGFKKELFYAQIDTEMLGFLKNHPELNRRLDEKNIPDFDRYVKGFMLWMRKQK